MSKQAKFLPFHAINEFMLTEYRKDVVRTVLSNLSKLPENFQRKINGDIKRYVSVQGFRNSAQAPLPLKINGTILTFEKSADFCGHILAAWSLLNPELRSQVFNLLGERDWEVLPAETDRSVLPGFLTFWPGEENFETLLEAFRTKYPDNNTSDNDISLMIVWMSNRLPYETAPVDEEVSES
jgi:hypothetical protein